MRLTRRWFAGAFGLAVGIAGAALAEDAAVRSVPSVDLTRYAGRWFEIARYPNRFQKVCVGDVTADYERRPDTRIRVVNRCRTRDGSTTEAAGVARLATPGGSTARLKVRFAPAFLSFIPAVWGDYWVLGLDADYRWAVVGDPSRDYLWILSRTAVLAPALRQQAFDVVVANGFDPERLVATPQTP